MKNLQSDILIELHVPDFEPVKSFYGSLGYEVVWEKQPEGEKGYLVMRSGASILNFYCGTDEVYNHSFFSKHPSDTPRGYGVEIVIPVDNVEHFYDGFKSKHPDYVVAELSKTHSHADFRAVDPFGYYLRFVERYNWVDGRDKNGKPIEG